MSSAMFDAAMDACPGRSETGEEEAACGGNPGTHAMHHRTDAEYDFLLSGIDESLRAVQAHRVNPTPQILNHPPSIPNPKPQIPKQDTGVTTPERCASGSSCDSVL
jgi:hypothetical protein